jgi:hypothetical protein
MQMQTIIQYDNAAYIACKITPHFYILRYIICLSHMSKKKKKNEQLRVRQLLIKYNGSSPVN